MRRVALERSRIRTTVDQEVLSRDVRGLRAANICAQFAKLRDVAEPSCRYSTQTLIGDVLVGRVIELRARLYARDHRIGFEQTRKNIVHRYVVNHGFARNARNESGKAGTRAV